MDELTELRRRVAESERREEQLRQAEASLARLATFPEQNPNPVIETDLEGVVTYLNPSAKARFPDLASVGLDHPVLAGLDSILKKLGGGEEESSQAELEIDGRIYEQKITYMAQSSVVRIFASDITELRQAEASLARLATFPEQNPNPVIETDLSGQVTYLNPVAKRRFPDLLAAGFQHPILAGLESVIDRLKQGKEQSFVRELEIGDYIYEQKTTYMAQNSLVRIFAYDITQRKRLQDQLQQSLSELEQTNKDLREIQVQLIQSEKMAAMASLVAGIAHEINTPMGAISSVQDTLSRAVDKLIDIIAEILPKEHRDDPKLTAVLAIIANTGKVIKTGSDRVVGIVQSMRSFARLDEAELKSVNIHDGIDDTLRLVQHDLGDRIEVIKNYGDVPPIVCYPGRLNQIFLCYLVNAIQAIEGRGQITITTLQVDDKLHVIIKDSGIGIPDENLGRIFEPGFTARSVGVGTGLGLSICYQIVQDHKGAIEVESRVGEGSTFTTILPYGFSGFMLPDVPPSP